MNDKKRILLCVAGMTPQIITETLFALHQKNERIDEIRVITTLEGRNQVLRTLLDEKSGKFYQFCRDFGIDSARIKFNEETIALLDKPDGTILSDIRTVEDNILAGDKICKIVAELCKDGETRIHASAAGGRKTMSIYLTAAMQLFGRADDTLSHVLVSEDFENHPNFFYPPPTAQTLDIIDRETKKVRRRISTENARIYLAEVPFIRLQATHPTLLVNDGQTYGDVVKKAQTYLDAKENNFKLRLDLRENRLSVGTLKAVLSDYEMLLYLLFVEKKTRAENEETGGFVFLNELCAKDFEKAFQRIIIAKEGEECSLTEERLKNTDWEFLRLLVKQCESNKSADYDDFMNSVIRAVGRANKKLRKAGIPTKYEITSKGISRPKRYGLDISPELFEVISN